MQYHYEASDSAGVITRGEFEAASKEAAIEHLVKRNLIPLKLEQKGLAAGGSRINLKASLFEKITPLDRILFVRNLSATLKAGLNIIEALDILIVDAKKNMVKEFLIKAKLNLQSGHPLSATFYSQKKFFPPIFVGMLRTGEASGNLDKTLNELSRYLTREYNLKRRIGSALAYPVVLLTASIAVILLLMIFVLPRLTKTFRQSGADFPLITKIFLKGSEIISYSPILDLIVFIGLVSFFVYFKKTPLGQRLFLKLFFRIPVTRELIKKVALVRFTRTLGSLVASGTSIIESLELAADAVSNDVYKKAILKVVKQVKSGVPFSRALEGYPDLFPHFLTSLVVVGERTGTMDYILKTFADFYDDEFGHTLKNFTTFLEPVLLLFMGIVIGAVALSILLPIYQLVGKFT